MTETILVIDDDEVLSDALKSLLEMSGYNVLIAHTAEDGLQLTIEFEPGLIICDYSLPFMNGHDFTMILREKYFISTPVLLTTGMDITSLGRLPDSVVSIQKPFDITTMLTLIESQLA